MNFCNILDIPPNKSEQLNDKAAPLALPEEISGSTCTSIVSMSPERILNPIDERLRRSMTTNSEDRTIVSMHEDFMALPVGRLESSNNKNVNNNYENASSIISPESVGMKSQTFEIILIIFL